MIEVKGDLRGASDFIMKNKIRNSKGEPQHKSEFRLNDRPSLISFLRILKDKFGVTCFEIVGKDRKTLVAQQTKEAEEELSSLSDFQKRTDDDSDFREKTRGLREPDKEFQEKMKKLI